MTDQTSIPADIAAAAAAAHRALDAVGDNWHYTCMQPDDDDLSPSCFKGQPARRMLEEDVIPAVLAALVGAGWMPPPTPMSGADDLPEWERDLFERQAARDQRFG